jgi:hypothetical protein
MKLVWLDLDSICKSYKEKRKTENEKCFRSKKNGKGRQQPTWAMPKPAAHLPP